MRTSVRGECENLEGGGLGAKLSEHHSGASILHEELGSGLGKGAMGWCGERSFSDGLRRKVFPVVIAIGIIQSGHLETPCEALSGSPLGGWCGGYMTGKLNGVIPAQTPSGCRISYESMLRLT